MTHREVSDLGNQSHDAQT